MDVLAAQPPRGVKPKLFSSEFLSNTWAKAFFFVVVLQAVICVAFEL